MVKRGFLCIIIVIVLLVGWSSASGILIIDRFSSGAEVDGIPSGWRPLHFPKIRRHTRYTLVQDGGNTVVTAVSNQSASAIFKETAIDPKSYPVLTWRWKVEGVLKRGDGRVKSGDDYAARVYVTFLSDTNNATLMGRIKRRLAKRIYGIDPPGRAINYIWANRIKQGASIPNAYTSEAQMIAVESGASKAGKWISEEVDIYRDYKRLFGEEPPQVTGIAIMTDTDNTGERATAYYDDIVFRKR
ncbi:MAG: DUF3047 domain-containing protein [Deltaproteobacteria bacterium]|nr:DUF3047 domain-containing protein [Deltaproteobacteria bacterium]